MYTYTIIPFGIKSSILFLLVYNAGMNCYMENISRNLRELMGEMTVSELAEKIEIPQPTLSRYLLCQREITLDNLIKIADFFDEDIDILIGRKNY